MFNQNQPNAAIEVNLQLPCKLAACLFGPRSNKLGPNSWKAGGFDELYDCPDYNRKSESGFVSMRKSLVLLSFRSKVRNKNATIN
jgi:hypothetical protein